MHSAAETAAGEYAAPVLAVCGFSGSGKTTLLVAAIARLVERGLAVAVVKHTGHDFAVDVAGKDSERLFRAGATISLRGPGQQFERRAEPLSLATTLARLGCDHDLLLVEGHKQTALPKFWLCAAGEAAAPPEVSGVLATLDWQQGIETGGRLAAFLDCFDRWYPEAWQARRLRRGLLVGGGSTRMGQPKQMLSFGGRALGEIAASALAEAGQATPGQTMTSQATPGQTMPGEAGVVVLGAGALPPGLRAAAQLPDAPDFAGPGAGLIAAHRWAPQAGWIVAACDHPWLRPEHIGWLAAQRQPGRWAVVPRQRDGHPNPMLALYEPQALEAMERLAEAHPGRNADPSAVLRLSRTAVVEPPEELADGWANVNTPDELRAAQERLARHPEKEHR